MLAVTYISKPPKWRFFGKYLSSLQFTLPYRSYLSPEEVRRADVLHRGLLYRGGVLSSYGLMALLTPMTDFDVEEILSLADGTIAEVAKQ